MTTKGEGAKEIYGQSEIDVPRFSAAELQLMLSTERSRRIDLVNRLTEENRSLREALEKTLVALVSYKRYVPEPYKQNPIYIVGANEAEQLAKEALTRKRGSRCGN